MRKFLILLVAAALPVHAEETQSNFYWGATLGQSGIDLGIDSVSNTTVDQTDVGFSGIIGYAINDNFSIEGHYANLGEASINMAAGGSYVSEGVTVTNTSGSPLKVVVEGSSLGAGLVFHGDRNNDFVPFVKAGYQSWEFDAAIQVAGINVSVKDDGTDLMYGAGALQTFGDDWGLRYEATIFQFDSENVSLVSIGIVKGF